MRFVVIAELEGALHKTIRKVSEDIEAMKYNTAIAAMMSLLNDICAKGSVNHAELRTFILLLNPFAPHMTEEMWERAGHTTSVLREAYPVCDESKLVRALIDVPVQQMGKLKGTVKLAPDADEAAATAAALALLGVASAKKVIYKPGKIINVIV